MNKEETISNLKAYLNGDTAVGNIIPLRSVLESAIKYLSKSSLPSDLDEAANNYGIDIRLGYPRVMDETDKYIYNAFKAGAEWMAGQGVVVDAEVCKLTDRAWVTLLDEKLSQNELYNKFNAGDKVVVQIRKK